MKRSLRGAARWPVALLILAAWASAAAAADAGPSEVEGWRELLEYAKCALSVAGASSTWGLIAAVVSCIFDALFD